MTIPNLIRSSVLCSVTLFSFMANASTLKLTTTETSVIPYGTENTFMQEISDNIDKGSLDTKEVSFPIDLSNVDTTGWQSAIEYKGSQAYIIVNSKTWGMIPQNVKSTILNALLSYYGINYFKAYIPSVNTKENAAELNDQELLKRLHTNIAQLSLSTPVQNLLSPYAQQWAYKDSGKDGPNCWHTSMASIFPNWTNHRYMPPQEFSCHALGNSFEKIDTPEQIGDLIRLTDSKTGEEVHGFTFIGTDKSNPARKIVFTKNGSSRGYFVFMDLNDVLNKIYPGNKVSYYRAIANETDPSNNPQDPSLSCSAEYSQKNLKMLAVPFGATTNRENEDPILSYGLKHTPPRTFAPLKVR